jgi:hypothetical protein
MILLILKKPLGLKPKVYKSSADFVDRFIAKDKLDVLIVDSSNRMKTGSSVSVKADSYVDLTNVNDCKSICSYFQTVNEHLNHDALFIGCVQTHNQKIASQKISKIPILKTINKWYEFLIHRAVPKTKGIRHIYNGITRRKNRRLTKTEVLGRLVRAGFSIVDIEENIEGRLFFAARKFTNKVETRSPGFGLLYKMPRIGKDGKVIFVYKLRTMHPFAEYLQGFIFERNGTKDGDKLINDFRVSKWGKFLRKYWIDELPMILNLLKGDIKLVGIRPLSRHKFETYPKALQVLRTKTKPGLFPPYYADLPKNQLDFFKSEEKYLRAYLRLGKKVDKKYLSMCLNNIIIKMKRSA